MINSSQGQPRRCENGQGNVPLSLEDEEIRNHRKDWWGHKIGKKRSKAIRICTLNVNSLGLSNQSLKDRAIQTYMEEKDIDLMSLTETNVKWSMIEEKDRIWARVGSWFEKARVAVGCNKKKLKDLN